MARMLFRAIGVVSQLGDDCGMSLKKPHQQHYVHLRRDD